MKISPKSSSKGSSSNQTHPILTQMRLKRKRRVKTTRRLINYQALMTKLRKKKPKTKKHLLLSRHPPKQLVTSKHRPNKDQEEAIPPMTTHLLKVAQRRAPVLTQLPNSLKRKIPLQGSLKSKKLMRSSKIMRVRSRRARMSKIFLTQMLAAMEIIRKRRLQSSLPPQGTMPSRRTRTRTKRRSMSLKPSCLICKVS